MGRTFQRAILRGCLSDFDASLQVVAKLAAVDRPGSVVRRHRSCEEGSWWGGKGGVGGDEDEKRRIIILTCHELNLTAAI
jgi:hypothetical protein